MKPYIYFWTLTIITSLTASACLASDSPASVCMQWAEKARKEVESVPKMADRYKKVLEQIAQGCPSIPLRLRKAAKESLHKSVEGSRRILMDAAAPYFDPSCAQEAAIMPAVGFAKKCTGRYHGNYELRYIDAGTLMFGLALEEEFNKLGINHSHPKVLVHTLYLSNQHYWNPD